MGFINQQTQLLGGSSHFVIKWFVFVGLATDQWENLPINGDFVTAPLTICGMILQVGSGLLYYLFAYTSWFSWGKLRTWSTNQWERTSMMSIVVTIIIIIVIIIIITIVVTILKQIMIVMMNIHWNVRNHIVSFNGNHHTDNQDNKKWTYSSLVICENWKNPRSWTTMYVYIIYI